MGCIFNLESTPYDWRLNPRQLFFKILEEAGCLDLFPQYQVLKVDMNGKRTKSTHTSADRKPAMVVHFSCEELVFTLLKLKSKFREAGEAVEKKYRNVFIKKSVPQEYKDEYKKFDEIRGSLAAITINENGHKKRVYDVRIDFLGVYMVIKHRLFEQDKGGWSNWDLYKVWAPQMKNMTEVNPPRPSKCLLPILMLKIQPNDPRDRLQLPEEGVEDWKNLMKNSLPGDLAKYIVYQDMNKRRTI